MLSGPDGLIYRNKDSVVYLRSRRDAYKGSKETIISNGDALDNKAMLAITRSNIVGCHKRLVSKNHIVTNIYHRAIDYGRAWGEIDTFANLSAPST